MEQGFQWLRQFRIIQVEHFQIATDTAGDNRDAVRTAIAKPRIQIGVSGWLRYEPLPTDGWLFLSHRLQLE